MLRFLTVALAPFSLAGCATMTRDTKGVLVVRSTPQGAQVTPSNGETCAGTPRTFKLPRKSKPNLVVSQDRCQPQHVRVTNRVEVTLDCRKQRRTNPTARCNPACRVKDGGGGVERKMTL